MSIQLPDPRKSAEGGEWKPATQKVMRIVRGTKVLQPIGKKALPKPRVIKKEEAPAEEEKSIEWLLKEWLSFNEKLGAALGGNSGNEGAAAPLRKKTKKERPKRLFNPSKPLEIQKNIKKLEFRPEIKNGKLYFSCPCCHFPTTVFEHYAGLRTRCSRCLSAIKAPHPERGHQARNLERDVETILHPDRFVGVLPKRRTIWTVLPRTPLHLAFGITGAVTLAILIGLGSLLGTKDLSAEVQPAVDSPFITAQELRDLPSDSASKKVLLPPADHRERATSVVERFVHAKTTAEKRFLVKDSKSVAIHLGNFYSGDSSRGEEVISTSALAYYMDAGAPIPVTEVVTLDREKIERVYLVEHRPERDFIDWEASVGFNPRRLSKVLSVPPSNAPEVRPLRLLASIDNYYNFRFDDEDRFLCIRLSDPNEQGGYAFGYIERDHPDVPALERYLAGADSWSPFPLTVDVRPADSSGQTGQLEIVQFKGNHWRSFDAAGKEPSTVIAQN